MSLKILVTFVIAVVVILGGSYILYTKQAPILTPSSSQIPISSIAVEASGSVSISPMISSTMSPTPSSTTQSKAIKASMLTAKGTIELELYPDVAPVTVANFIKLAKSGFYNSTKFHRVVADFVIQGGDPLSKTDDPNVGSGGPGYVFKDEINPRSLGVPDATIKQLEATGYQYDYSLKSLPMTVGALAMANSGPNTNGSQFFIVTTHDQPYLNGKHTVFGKVIKGMDVVLKITQGDVISKIAVH